MIAYCVKSGLKVFIKYQRKHFALISKINGKKINCRHPVLYYLFVIIFCIRVSILLSFPTIAWCICQENRAQKQIYLLSHPHIYLRNVRVSVSFSSTNCCVIITFIYVCFAQHYLVPPKYKVTCRRCQQRGQWRVSTSRNLLSAMCTDEICRC